MFVNPPALKGDSCRIHKSLTNTTSLSRRDGCPIQRRYHKPCHHGRWAMTLSHDKIVKPPALTTLLRPGARRMRAFDGPSFWLEFSSLAQLTASVNLGHGLPGFGPPDFLKDALAEGAYCDEYSQYAHPGGAMPLLKEIARVYGPMVVPSPTASPINPASNVIVTYGASQAISLACTAFLNPGDEVILLEPAFDVYTAAVRLADATPVSVPLHARDGSVASSAQIELDMDEFISHLSERTRMLILNSPHNPTGKVFTRTELKAIADAIDIHAPGCIVLSDEVYEQLVFDGCVHVPFASVSPSAHARTLSVYSVGKTFSSTGWKVGWIVAPKPFVDELKMLQQNAVFCVSHVMQIAYAQALKTADLPFEGFPSYYSWLRNLYRVKRDLLVDAVRAGGMVPIIPQGAFYVCAYVPTSHPARRHVGLLPPSIRALVESGEVAIDETTLSRPDYTVARNLIASNQVASIPLSAFYEDGHVGKFGLSRDFVRFACCHSDEVLLQAHQRLQDY